MNQVGNRLETKSGQRIQYIDAMRGFTMILVVYYHIAHYCWLLPNDMPSFHKYLLQVRMPLFFFISGFVLYKAGVVWNGQQIIKFFRKKIPVQLIAPLVFFILFLHVRDLSFMESITDVYKKGYWFTFVLLEYYVFYSTVRFFVRNETASSVILILLGLLFFFLNWHQKPLSSQVLNILSAGNWDRFIFFVLGTVVKKNFTRVERLLDSKWFIAFCVLYYFLINGISDMIPVDHLASVVRLSLSLTGLVIIFTFFRNHQDSFSKNTVIGNSLQYIGRRTLDVYLIHFFLLPLNLSFITIFIDHPMPIIEAAVSLIISLVIVAVSLLIGNVIRLSPRLAHYVFGAKLLQENK